MTITNHTFWITLVCGKDDVFNEITYIFKDLKAFLWKARKIIQKILYMGTTFIEIPNDYQTENF